jgi:hypothetical protein
VVTVDSDNETENEAQPKPGMLFVTVTIITPPIALPAKKKRAKLGNPVEKDKDGFLMDVDVQPIDPDPPSREDKRRDVDEFFRAPALRTVNSKQKKYRTCKLCP